MPKSKGTGSSTPKLKSTDKAKESALDTGADVGDATCVFTRSRARRLSITVPDHVSPPKRSRRSSISKKESSTQDTKDQSVCLGMDNINEEINSTLNAGEISKSTPSPKKRKSKKANESESAEKIVEIEEQESGSTKKLKSSRKSLEEGVQVKKSETEVKSSKRDKSRNRKSTIMERIQEDVTLEEADSTRYVEPSKINGLSNEAPKIDNSAKGLVEEESIISIEKPCPKLTPKSTPCNSLGEPDTTPQTVSEKTVVPAKLSSKKTPKAERSISIAKLDDTPLQVSKKAPYSSKEVTSETAPEKTPKAVESPSIDNTDDTPLNISKKSKHSAKKIKTIASEETPKAMESPIDNLNETPLKASKKSKHSAKKTEAEIAIEETPKAVESPIDNLAETPLKASKKSKHSAKKPKVEIPIEETLKAMESRIDNLDETPLKASKKSKHSAKKPEVEIAIEETPTAMESPIDNFDETPLKASKKSKHSAKKTKAEITSEKTPKAVESPSIDNLDETPLTVSKKLKHSAKKPEVEIAIEKTSKAVESPSNDNLNETSVKVSKKLKHSAKKPVDNESCISSNVELPLTKEMIMTPQPITKTTEAFEKQSATKSITENEMTPKKNELPTVEMLGKTLVPVLKKPTSPVKVSAKKAVIEDDTDSDEDSDAESRKEIMRSAEKRIIRNLSTSESESRNHVKVLQLPVVDLHAGEETESSTDSDSAPEDVTFDASRQSALELLKQTVDSIKRDKQKKKEKRKERLEVWRQRKEENLIRLKESKANRDDASCSSSEESLHERNGLLKISGKKTYIDDEPAKPNLKRLPADIVNSLPEHFPKVPKMPLPPSKDLGEKETTNIGRKRKGGINGKMVTKVGNLTVPNMKKDVDFRRLPGGGTTTFGVVALNEPTLTSVAEKAANFKKNLLYGKRICRAPVSTLVNNRKKLEVNMK